MQPMYVKKSDPKLRTTWLDNFIALEPKGGVEDAVELARHGRAKAVFTAILGLGSEGSRAAA